MELLFFFIFAIIAVLSSIAVVTAKNPVHSALYLAVVFLQIAALYILLRSPFLAAVQVFIYVGAVMVLFLFVVLVLDLGKERFKEDIYRGKRWIFASLALMVVEMGYLILRGTVNLPEGPYMEEALKRNTEVIGRLLFTKYLFPFEVLSLLLLVALIGAIVLSMKEKR